MDRKRTRFGLGGFDLYIARTISVIEARSHASRKRADRVAVLTIPPMSKRCARPNSDPS